MFILFHSSFNILLTNYSLILIFGGGDRGCIFESFRYIILLLYMSFLLLLVYSFSEKDKKKELDSVLALLFLLFFEPTGFYLHINFYYNWRN